MDINLLDDNVDISSLIKHKVSTIYHCASVISPYGHLSTMDKTGLIQQELMLLKRIKELALKTRADEVVLFTTDPANQDWEDQAYLTVQKEIYAYADLFTVLKLPYLYGIFQDENGLLPCLLRTALSGLPASIPTHVKLIHSDDVALKCVNRAYDLTDAIMTIAVDQLAEVLKCLRTNHYQGLQELYYQNGDGQTEFFNLESSFCRSAIYKLLELIEHNEINKGRERR
ncbi:hypothetical protein R70331_07160 [Paenibacillus sp. FSL R7-0331]|nr:hypothetical protein R70331_07160 [Paenibacillus sp. FSL R7-0331]